METLFGFIDKEIDVSKKSLGLGKLEFDNNWNNKLDCTSYTTIRFANPSKYKVGRRFAVYLNGKRIHDAEIVDIKTIYVEQINEWIARLDTGCSCEACKAMVKTGYQDYFVDWDTQQLNWILFRKLEY